MQARRVLQRRSALGKTLAHRPARKGASVTTSSLVRNYQHEVERQKLMVKKAEFAHATASVRFVFVSAAEEAKLSQVLELSNLVLAFLRERGHATRSQISVECFRGKVSKVRIDASLEQLLAATPPRITVEWIEREADTPGTPTRVYRLV